MGVAKQLPRAMGVFRPPPELFFFIFFLSL
jgi:hypothetical protein